MLKLLSFVLSFLSLFEPKGIQNSRVNDLPSLETMQGFSHGVTIFFFSFFFIFLKQFTAVCESIIKTNFFKCVEKWKKIIQIYANQD